MPEFDLRRIRIAKYTYDSEQGKITYGTPIDVGDAMTANVELRFAEGRLYAESRLAEYMRHYSGVSVSLGVKYIKDAAQKELFGAYELQRNVSSKQVKSLTFGKGANGNYVGCTFYSPDMIDGAEKFTCVFMHKALFSPPTRSLQTLGDTITFSTPTTTGEAMVDDKGHLSESVTVATEAEAIAWCEACFSAEPTTPSGSGGA